MHRAARDGDVDALRRAVETNVSPDVACPDGLVPLHCVVHYASRHRRPHGVSDRDRETAAYLRKVRAAGGIKKYERAHLNAFTASFAPKFSHLLPPELVRRVVEYAFHVGDYWTTSVRAE